MHATPLGLFITWTVYGTFLPGDVRGWRHRNAGNELEMPQLEAWHQNRLKYDVVTLDDQMRSNVESAIGRICDRRSWMLWAKSARSNHVHVVITAPEYDPTLVRDQLKANATRKLRAAFRAWEDRPVWAAKGDIEYLDTEDQIEQCVIYVNEAQDHKDRDRM